MSSSRFTPSPLPRWELSLSYLVWLVHSIGAFFIAYQVSESHLNTWVRHWLKPSGYVNGSRMDLADSEWNVYRKGIHIVILDHAVHSIGFFIITSTLKSSLYSQIALIALGVATQIHMTSLTCFLVFGLFTLLATSLACLTRSRILSWLLCISFVIKAAEYVPFTIGEHTFYREFNLYLYGAIKALNFCLYFCNNPTVTYKSLLIDHLLYVAYLPYSVSLIVLFDDFQRQMNSRLERPTVLPGRATIIFGFRLIFWYFAFEGLLHFIYVHSFFNAPFSVIVGMDNYELASISYVNGQLFHIKYVLIFGLPSFFAYVDGMVPPPPPICISRVSRYSRMWRHFDHGLHQFLKHQVYLPLMRPVLPPLLSALRGLLTLVAVFGVVIGWHGARLRYLCWVSLSALELLVEWLGQWIWATDRFQKFRGVIGETNTRRLVALGMIGTVIPGIFGVFFFLGEEGTGAVVFDRLLAKGIQDIYNLNVAIERNNSGFVLLQLLFLGYFFNQVCLELDIGSIKTPIGEAKKTEEQKKKN